MICRRATPHGEALGSSYFEEEVGPEGGVFSSFVFLTSSAPPWVKVFLPCRKTMEQRTGSARGSHVLVLLGMPNQTSIDGFWCGLDFAAFACIIYSEH